MVIMDFKEWSYEGLSEHKKCCTDCKTTKTPLWRGGPAGPKTLCNACGIRYRKRRVSPEGLNNKGQERKRERTQSRGGGGAANGTSTGTTASATSSSATSSVKTDGVGGTDLRESLKMRLMALGEEVLLQRLPSAPAVKKQRRKLGEEEQAALCLMALSCSFVFA